MHRTGQSLIDNFHSKLFSQHEEFARLLAGSGTTYLAITDDTNTSVEFPLMQNLVATHAGSFTFSYGHFLNQVEEYIMDVMASPWLCGVLSHYLGVTAPVTSRIVKDQVKVDFGISYQDLEIAKQIFRILKPFWADPTRGNYTTIKASKTADVIFPITKAMFIDDHTPAIKGCLKETEKQLYSGDPETAFKIIRHAVECWDKAIDVEVKQGPGGISFYREYEQVIAIAHAQISRWVLVEEPPYFLR